METHQITLTQGTNYKKLIELWAFEPNLVMVFGDESFFTDNDLFPAITKYAPKAVLVGCSTAGEIIDKGINNDSCIVTAIKFNNTQVTIAEANCLSMGNSHSAGAALASEFYGVNLNAVLLFGKGVDINGSALIEGLQEGIADDVPITGGLAADNGKFEKTYVLTPTGIHSDKVVAVGLSGPNLQVSYGSYGGWSPFGQIRKVTKCRDNVLYELDGQPALEVSKMHIGDKIETIPSTGLLFPFEMLNSDYSSVGIIRTILGFDKDDGSMTLAGNIDPNGYLRLMHADNKKLVDGAKESAKQTLLGLENNPKNGLALLVSCVGRRLVMGDNAREEILAVNQILGADTTITGFYSNGEIAPFSATTECKLHNQTMTITYINEL